MKNRAAFELSPEQVAYTGEFRQSHEAHTIMERIRLPEDAPDYSIQFLDNRTSRGFLIDFALIPYSFRNAIALMEILKENCRDHGYVLYMSDAYEQEHQVVRHYLKPSYKHMTSMPMDQLFGNVTMELRYVHPETPHQLKVTATNYPGPNYVSNTSILAFLEMITRL